MTSETIIPEFTSLFEFYEHIHASPPLDKDFDIRMINPEVLKAYDFIARPFRHKFYCVALYLEGNATLNNGYWKTHLERPAIYFKTPNQILSWNKPQQWLREYFIVFTEQFALRHKPLADVIFDLPFFKMEKTIPFEISTEDTATVTELFEKIQTEYRSSDKDRFEMISYQTLVLLVNIRRLFHAYVETDKKLSIEVKKSENSLIEKFERLLRNSLAKAEPSEQLHSVKRYASLLSTHPNHLNAVVKRKTGKTALSVIHEHLTKEAKALLSQTTLPIKQISSAFGFRELPHFNNFFKKQTGRTPLQFRRQPD